MGRVNTTKAIYLANLEKLPEAEIAKLAGVSRQRIHQLEQQFQVCKMTPSLRHKHFCIDCGIQVDADRKNARCNACAYKERTIELECPTCGTKFRKSKKEYAFRVNHGRKQFFCSRKCLGVDVGNKYGKANLIAYHKEHHRVPKWDYDMIWQKHMDTHYGTTRLAKLLGIPCSTISTILTKKRKELGIASARAMPKYDHAMVWNKYLETGYNSAKLARLLNVPYQSVYKIIRKKAQQAGIETTVKRHKPNKDLIWSKHLETGYGALRLSRLLNIPESTITKVLHLKRNELKEHSS